MEIKKMYKKSFFVYDKKRKSKITIKNTTRQKNFFFVSVAVLRIARIGKYFQQQIL